MTPQTPAQRKASERQRKASAGLREVRGIWLRPDQHARLKAYVKAAKLFNAAEHTAPQA